MIFADIQLSDAETANHYASDKVIPYIISEPTHTIVHYDQIIKDIQNIMGRGNAKVLDFGCGTGMFVRRCIHAGLDAQGIDHSPYVEVARDAFNLPLHCCDLVEAPFLPGQFDVIFSHATFEHLYDPLFIGEALLRFLKPGGIVVFTAIPNFNTISIRIFRSFYANTPPGHINYFTPTTLTNLFCQLGLKEVSVQTYGFDIWYLLGVTQRLNQSARTFFVNRVSETMTNQLNRELQILNEKLNNPQVHLGSKLVANLYAKGRIPGMGVSLYGLARKER